MIDRAIYRYIEHELYNYEFYKKELELERMMILEGSPSPPDGQPKGNQAGNPTEQKAVRLTSSIGIIQLERTINAISQTISELDKLDYDVYVNVYAKGRKDKLKMCNDIGISFSGLKRAKRRIITKAGIKLGVIRSLSQI